MTVTIAVAAAERDSPARTVHLGRTSTEGPGEIRVSRCRGTAAGSVSPRVHSENRAELSPGFYVGGRFRPCAGSEPPHLEEAVSVEVRPTAGSEPPPINPRGPPRIRLRGGSPASGVKRVCSSTASHRGGGRWLVGSKDRRFRHGIGNRGTTADGPLRACFPSEGPDPKSRPPHKPKRRAGPCFSAGFANWVSTCASQPRSDPRRISTPCPWGSARFAAVMNVTEKHTSRSSVATPPISPRVGVFSLSYCLFLSPRIA